MSNVGIVRNGDHFSYKISRQIDPSDGRIFGWKIFVLKLILGGLKA